MEHELRANLLICAKTYAAAKNVSLATLARLAAGDWRFFSRLDDERTTFTARKYDEVIKWISENWPDDVEWPVEVARVPSPSTEEAA